MKAFLRWIGKILGGALTLVLAIVLFPYASKWVAQVLPDESGAAIKASAIISTHMKETARLESMQVEEEGVLNYDIQAAFIGSVANINIQYQYVASFGINLDQVQMRIEDNTLTFLLPEAELILDNITPTETYRNDFWYPGFNDDDLTKLLEDERTARRNIYLNGEKVELLKKATQNAFESMVAGWLKELNANITINYEHVTDACEQ